MAAPTATTSSGLTPRCGSLPVSSLTFSWTAGHARQAADQHDVVDLLDALVLGVVQRLADRADDALDQRARPAR